MTISINVEEPYDKNQDLFMLKLSAKKNNNKKIK